MNTNGFFKAHDDGEVVLMLKNGMEGTDISRLVASIGGLSVESAPEGATILHPFNGRRWGKGAYVIGGFFVKASYACRHADRNEPFAGLEEAVEAYAVAEAHGVPVPELQGYFSRKTAEGWLWNGIVTGFLEGWSVLDERTASDREMGKEVIRALAAKGVCDGDLHFPNIMRNGEEWKLVDLDQLRETEPGSKDALAGMANRCAALAATPVLRDEMNKFVSDEG